MGTSDDITNFDNRSYDEEVGDDSGDDVVCRY